MLNFAMLKLRCTMGSSCICCMRITIRQSQTCGHAYNLIRSTSNHGLLHFEAWHTWARKKPVICPLEHHLLTAGHENLPCASLLVGLPL